MIFMGRCRQKSNLFLFSCILAAALLLQPYYFVSQSAAAQKENKLEQKDHLSRPLELVNDMDPGPVKDKLLQCSNRELESSDFSIAHRGASLGYPEHTREAYIAAAQMGAGIIECDVTFTKDMELVCRHSQCDLHRTTDILLDKALAPFCRQQFTPAIIDDETGEIRRKASAKCCTSDITLAQFKTLEGRMDRVNSAATTAAEYLQDTSDPVIPVVTEKGTVLSHEESIKLFKKLGVKMVPELKSPEVKMPYQGSFTQQAYAQKLVDEYKAAGVVPEKVFLQSFNLRDVKYWLVNEPAFAKQSIFLDGRYRTSTFNHSKPKTWTPDMEALVRLGVRYIAPPMWMLLALDEKEQIVPSHYAIAAEKAGLAIIPWTMERSGSLAGGGGWYYRTVDTQINNDGDMLTVLDVLARQVGIKGIFADWPATVTYYANCNGL